MGDKITWITEKRKLGDLKAWDKNPRQLSDHDAKNIKESMDTFGLADPLIVNTDNTIIGGHMRKRVIGDPGQLVDVRVPDRRLTDREVEELNIRLNRNSGEFDFDILANEFEVDDLLDWGFTEYDLEIGGFEFDEDTPEDPGAQIDKAEELREKWQVESGQLWQLGNHRLVCGDCTDAEVVERVMGGERAQLLFTSPPYWVGKDYEAQSSLQDIKTFIDKVSASMSLITNRDGGRIIVNCSTALATAINKKADPETLFTLAWWQDALRENDWLMRHCRIWLKSGDMKGTSPRTDMIDQHWETIPEFLPTFYYPDGLRRGQERIKTKWAQLGYWSDIQGDRSAGGKHCAAFPLELPERYIKLYSIEEEMIADLFLGSGTTLIACERLNRKCRGIEIEPKYVGVTLERWHEMTGDTPVLVE